MLFLHRLRIEANSIIEYCIIEGTVSIGRNCLLSNLEIPVSVILRHDDVLKIFGSLIVSLLVKCNLAYALKNHCSECDSCSFMSVHKLIV